PVLSSERVSHRDSTAAGAPRRHSVAGGPLRAQVLARNEQENYAGFARCDERVAAVSLAGQRARVGKRGGARDGGGAGTRTAGSRFHAEGEKRYSAGRCPQPGR